MKNKIIISFVILILIFGGFFIFEKYQKRDNQKIQDLYTKIDLALQNNPQNKIEILNYIDKLYYKYKDSTYKYKILDKVKSYILKKQENEYEKNLELKYIYTLNIYGGAKPEIIATGDKINVIYLDISNPQKKILKSRVYNAKTRKQISEKTLIKQSDIYGNPTDIKITSDGNYVYAFYVTENDKTQKSYLWGEKFDLKNNFESLIKTNEPMASNSSSKTKKVGEEYLDDPTLVLGPNGPIIITRIKTSLSKIGQSIINVRKFDTNLNGINDEQIDLSQITNGEARPNSCIYKDGYFYMVIPTTVSDEYTESDLTTPSDIVMIKFDVNWGLEDYKTISQQYNDTETHVTGFGFDGKYFFMAYRDIVNTPKLFDQMYVPIKIYDKNFNIIYSRIIYTLNQSAKNVDWRPNIYVTKKKLYLGIGLKNDADIMIFEK